MEEVAKRGQNPRVTTETKSCPGSRRYAYCPHIPQLLLLNGKSTCYSGQCSAQPALEASNNRMKQQQWNPHSHRQGHCQVSTAWAPEVPCESPQMLLSEHGAHTAGAQGGYPWRGLPRLQGPQHRTEQDPPCAWATADWLQKHDGTGCFRN